MAQVTDRNIGANPTGFDMRTEINNIIAALESDNSGASEPLNTVAYMKWLDTSNATYYYYKERNHDNTAWVTLFRYTVATKIMEAVSNGVVIDDATVVHKTGDETKAGVLTLTDGLKLQGQNVSPFSGFKNYIINGNFDVWQRGTSQIESGYGSDDRWFNSNIGSTKSHSQVACSDTERALFNANFFSRTVVTSVVGAGNVAYKQQKIEDVTKLAGKTVTLSFWAKADSSKNIAIDFRQNFGSGGSPSATVVGIQPTTVSLTTTWQKKTITVTLPTIIGKVLGTDGVHTSSTYFQFWFDAGTVNDPSTNSLGQQSGTFDIAQVQLEEGSVATPFEQRPYGLELSLCQRYYEIGQVDEFYNFSGASNNIGTGTKYKNTKRVTPTVVLSYGFLEQNRIDGFSMYGTIGPGLWLTAVVFSASAEL